MDRDQSPAAPPSHNVVVTSPPANMPSQPEGSSVTSSTASILSSAESDSSVSSASTSHPHQLDNHPSEQYGSFTGYQPPPTHSGYLPVEHALPHQHSHHSDSPPMSHGGTYNMTGMQQALPGVNMTAPGSAAVYGQVLPKGPPTTIPTHQRHPHNRHQTGASPAAVAYQLSQQMQHQYQGGSAAGTHPAQAPEASAFYGALSSPYQPHPGIYHDQFGRQFTVPPAHGPDLAAGSAVQQPNSHNPAIPSAYSLSYTPSYSPVPYATSPQVWYPVHGQQQPQGAPYVYIASPQPPTGYSGMPQHPASAPPFQFDRTQDPQRRHSVPVRPSRVNNRIPNYGPPSGPGLQPHPPTAPRHNGSHQSPATSSRTTTPSGLPRGPPRKPKQSGFAVWVGNLPVGANVVDVKDHFAKDLKHEIQSVKMMSKTDCAFINYRTEKAANEALAKFNESRFHGKKLVVRARRAVSEQNSAQASGDEDVDGSGTSSGVSKVKSPPIGPAGARPKIDAKDRYFIIKSLTVEDLEMSVRTGVWATQSENEKKLNQAFEAAENVYLIFSANRSGEYFGYARMASAITPSAASMAPDSSPSTFSTPPTVNSSTPAALPTSSPSIDPGTEILTPETDTAPRGRIVDDRDTLFWEILTDDEGSRPSTPSESSPSKRKSPADDTKSLPGSPVVVPSTTSRGNPFRVTWLSTKRVPFHLTRGLRNQLNSNREIKIARDATEVDEMAGRRLVQMFGWSGRRPVGPPLPALQPPVVGLGVQQQQQTLQGMPHAVPTVSAAG